jgi:nucleoside-diphosphate-sugar epimerase
MRVLLAGATGAIGRQLLPMLLDAGHEVHGTTRDAGRAEELEAAGATAHVVDFLRPGAAAELIEQVKPQVVIDQLTSLPEHFDPRHAADAWATNDRIRREGSGSLIEAAEAGGVERYILQSISFTCQPGDDRLKVESDPLWRDAPAPFNETVAVVEANENAVTRSKTFAGVVLRYGFLYGPGTWWADGGSTFEAVKKRGYPIIGDGAGVNSLVHVHDAAGATLRAIDHGRGTYNIVDDEPAAFNTLIPRFAELIGAKPPVKVPAFLARMQVGRYLVAAATKMPGASNAKARSELGWTPAVPSWRTGLRDYRDSSPTR